MPHPTVNLLLCSDLHLDAGNFDLSKHIEKNEHAGRRIDAVVLAGDIVEPDGGSPIAYALHHIPSYIPAVFVPGNHDYYGRPFGNIANRLRAQAHQSHVHFLDNDTLTVRNPQGDEVVLVCSSLWSNLQSYGPVVEADLKKRLPMFIADFHCMHESNGSNWSVKSMLSRFENSLAFLEQHLLTNEPQNRRRVVVTHFAPHTNSIHPKWQDNEVSAYFCNHLPHLVEKADLWLHGHTHDAFDYQVGLDKTKGRVVCHPRGYAGGFEKEQALNYAPKYIEVPVSPISW